MSPQTLCRFAALGKFNHLPRVQDDTSKRLLKKFTMEDVFVKLKSEERGQFEKYRTLISRTSLTHYLQAVSYEIAEKLTDFIIIGMCIRISNLHGIHEIAKIML